MKHCSFWINLKPYKNKNQIIDKKLTTIISEVNVYLTEYLVYVIRVEVL